MGFESGGFTNMVREFQGLDAYSYVFNGEAGYLDHALATGSLASQVTGASDWHINPDEPSALDYNLEFKSPNHQTTLYDPGPYRSSDHDPVVVGLDLAATPATLCAFVEDIAPRGIATSLCAKLDAAAAAEQRGDMAARAGQIAAFVHEVEAQRGKKISDANAAELIELAGGL